jgi:hypothetical protein
MDLRSLPSAKAIPDDGPMDTGEGVSGMTAFTPYPALWRYGSAFGAAYRRMIVLGPPHADSVPAFFEHPAGLEVSFCVPLEELVGVDE